MMKKTLIALMMMGLSTGAMAEEVSNAELLKEIKQLKKDVAELKDKYETEKRIKSLTSTEPVGPVWGPGEFEATMKQIELMMKKDKGIEPKKSGGIFYNSKGELIYD